MVLLQPWLQQFWQELRNVSPFNSFVLSCIFIASALTLFMYNYTRNDNRREFNAPPSTPNLPIIGNLHQIGRLPHRSLQALSKKYGPIMLMRIGSTPTLVISSAQLVQEMFKSHDITFSNRYKVMAAKILLYGCQDIASGDYDENWRQARKVCAIQLLSVNRVHSFHSVREEEVGRMIENIRYSCSKGGNSPINISDLLLLNSSNIISRCTLGKRFGNEEDDVGNRLSELSKRFAAHFVSICYGDYFSWLGWVDLLTGLVSSMKRTSKEWDQCLDQVIEEHKLSKKAEDDRDFVDILLHLQRDQDSHHVITPDMLKAILTDMIVAGTETSATTMEWIMAHLIKNPSTMKKAQEEVRRVMGKGKKPEIEKSDIDQMEYLKCVIKETLRLNSPIPLLIPRQCSADVKLGGYDICAKTRVMINAWAIQRDPIIWGDDAEIFIPERFENKDIDFKGLDFEFIPFGFGRRGCPGLSFAVAVIEHSIASLLYWFDWALPEGLTLQGLDMNEVFTLSAPRKVPLCLVPTIYSPGTQHRRAL